MSQRLRVGVMAYGLDRPLVGVNRVARELGSALLRQPELEIFFLTPFRRGSFVGTPGVRRVYLPGCNLLPGLLLAGGPLVALVARALGLDLVHDPIGVGPFTLGRWAGRFKRVITIHDAIAFEYPQGYPFANNLVHRLFVPATLGNVDLVATDSQHARRSLARHLGLPEAAVPVVPLGVSSSFGSNDLSIDDHVLAKHHLTRPYFLYLGAFKRHKNLLGLLDAWAVAAPRLPGHSLVLAGPTQWRFPQLEERLRQRPAGVQVLGYVPESDLAALYAGATAFVMPSLHEGFGIPVLEAMACGTAVICSNRSSLPEVAGDAAILVDPNDTAQLVDAMTRLAVDPVLAAEQRRRGRERAAKFTWDRAAGAYAQLYRELSSADRVAEARYIQPQR